MNKINEPKNLNNLSVIESLKFKNADIKKEVEQADIESSFVIGLAEERKRQHMSQRKLASLAGIKQSQIGRIEIGEISPTLSTIVKITSALRVNIVLYNKYNEVIENYLWKSYIVEDKVKYNIDSFANFVVCDIKVKQKGGLLWQL